MDDQNTSFFCIKTRFLFIVKGFLFETWLRILNIFFFPEIRPSLTTKLHKNENIYDEFPLNV